MAGWATPYCVAVYEKIIFFYTLLRFFFHTFNAGAIARYVHHSSPILLLSWMVTVMVNQKINLKRERKKHNTVDNVLMVSFSTPGILLTHSLFLSFLFGM